MRKTLLIFAFFSNIFLNHIVFAQDLNIKESFEKVLQNNDSLKASYSNIQKAQKLQDASYMLFAPSVDIIGNYTYMEKMDFHIDLPTLPPPIPISLPPMDIQFNDNHFAFGILNIAYPLYTGGKRISAINLSKLNVKDADFLMQFNKINLFEKLIKAYYGLKLSLEVYATLNNTQNGAKAHLDNATKLQENGQIAKIEYLSAKVEYDKAKNKALEAKDAAEIALLAFKTLLQDESISQNAFIDDSGNIHNLNLTSDLKISQKELDSLESYEKQALESYPTLQNITIKKQQAKELSKIELSSFLPNIGLYGGYILKDNKSLLNKAIPNWYVGISARFSILSPNGRIFKYQASQIAQNEAESLYQQAKKDILLLIQTTYKETLSAKNSFYNLDSTIELAQENLKLQEEAFMNGMANNTQVSDARNQLSLAQIQAKNAQYKYLLALAKLYAITNNIEGFYTFD